MATANFSIVNAKSYYTILDTYEDVNENGDSVEYTIDEWEFEDLLDSIRERGEEEKTFPISSKDWNSKLDARELCENHSNWATFGKSGNAWTTETNIASVIVVRSGYYSGAVLDYDIQLMTSQGDDFYLSDYDSIDDMVEDYLDTLEDIIDWKGDQHKWNIGTFKMHKENIRKWITDRLEKEIDKCENFCKSNSEIELVVSARFGNGETWYKRVA